MLPTRWLASLLVVGLLSTIGCDPDRSPEAPKSAEAELAASQSRIQVTITPTAASEVLRNIREAQVKYPLYLRLRVVPGGCTGFQNKLDLDPVTTADDQRVESNGITLVIDSQAAKVADGAVIDFVDTPAERGFKVTLQAAKPLCEADAKPVLNADPPADQEPPAP
jgi:iron-sulfur cluster assembly protein